MLADCRSSAIFIHLQAHFGTFFMVWNLRMISAQCLREIMHKTFVEGFFVCFSLVGGHFKYGFILSSINQWCHVILSFVFSHGSREQLLHWSSSMCLLMFCSWEETFQQFFIFFCHSDCSIFLYCAVCDDIFMITKLRGGGEDRSLRVIMACSKSRQQKIIPWKVGWSSLSFLNIMAEWMCSLQVSSPSFHRTDLSRVQHHSDFSKKDSFCRQRLPLVCLRGSWLAGLAFLDCDVSFCMKISCESQIDPVHHHHIIIIPQMSVNIQYYTQIRVAQVKAPDRPNLCPALTCLPSGSLISHLWPLPHLVFLWSSTGSEALQKNNGYTQNEILSTNIWPALTHLRCQCCRLCFFFSFTF